MWLFTQDGFYSVVADKDDTNIVWVRARVEADLVRLRDRYRAVTGPITEKFQGDYAYRFSMTRVEFARVMFESAIDIDYFNFKDTVRAKIGNVRAMLYESVWWRMMNLQGGFKASFGPTEASQNILDKKNDGTPGLIVQYFLPSFVIELLVCTGRADCITF